MIEALAAKGFSTRDWFKDKLSHAEVVPSVKELAKVSVESIEIHKLMNCKNPNESIHLFP